MPMSTASHLPQVPAEAAIGAITGVVLAGGMGSRMGGADKGLQSYRGQPLARHALSRLQPQVGTCLISANRHVETYAGFGAPVVRDDIPGFAGPLAGMLAAMERCTTTWLLTVPCDVPGFPHDLAARLLHAAKKTDAALAIPVVDAGDGGEGRPQPVFCLVQARLHASLRAWLTRGERRVMGWARSEQALRVAFDRPDDPSAFANINTLDELAALNRMR